MEEERPRKAKEEIKTEKEKNERQQEVRREDEEKTKKQEEIEKEIERIRKEERRQKRKNEEKRRERMESKGNGEKTREQTKKEETGRRTQETWREGDVKEEEEEEVVEKEKEEEKERNRRLEEIKKRREEELQMTLSIQSKYQEKVSKKATNNENKKTRGGRREPSPSPPLSVKERRQQEEEKTQKFRYYYYPCNSKVYLLAGKGAAAEGVAAWRVKGEGVVQLDAHSNTPIGKKYKFDRVFVKASNKTIYSSAVRGAVKHFCSTQNSLAIIFYGASHTGKSRYLMGPPQHPKGILQRSFADTLSYAKAVSSYFCLFRVSYVEIYNEKVEDLLTTTTTTTTTPLQVVKDSGGRVGWFDAREVVITKLQELEELYAQGHSEHMRRARRTKGRREAAHTIFRITMESLPRYRDYSRWEEVSVAVSFLDFVTVAGVELLPTIGNVTDELRGGPTVTRSLYTLHQFVVGEESSKSMLYDGRQTLLTRLLREALVGTSHSLFLCTCSLADTAHTRDTLRFGEAAAWLVQHPTRHMYSTSLLHTTIAAILQYHQAAKRFLVTQGRPGRGVRKRKQKQQEEEESRRVKQEVRRMLDLAATIFPINNNINTKKNEQLESEEEVVVARKRGRPRKYPIRTKPFGSERPTKIDYLALWKSRYLNTADPTTDSYKKRDREEKFYMAGPFTLTTTSKRHGLRHLYRTGSLRASDTATYYGGYLTEELKKSGRDNREENGEENSEGIEEEKEDELSSETDKEMREKDEVIGEEDEELSSKTDKESEKDEGEENEEECEIGRGKKRERDKKKHKMNESKERMREVQEEENTEDERMEEEEENEWEDVEEWIAKMDYNNWRQEEEGKEEGEDESNEEEETRGKDMKKEEEKKKKEEEDKTEKDKREEEEKKKKKEEEDETKKDKKNERRKRDENERENQVSKKEKREKQKQQNKRNKSKRKEEDVKTDKLSNEELEKMEKESRHEEKEEDKHKNKKEEISVKQSKENEQNKNKISKKQDEMKKHNDRNTGNKQNKEKQNKNRKKTEAAVEANQETEKRGNHQINKEINAKHDKLTKNVTEHKQNEKQRKHNSKKRQEKPTELKQDMKKIPVLFFNRKTDKEMREKDEGTEENEEEGETGKGKRRKKGDKMKRKMNKGKERMREVEEEDNTDERMKEKEEGERTQGMVSYVRGAITITRAWDVCVDGEATQRLAKEFEMESYKPKKVSFCLSNVEYRGLKWKLDDGYVHFLRLGLWVQYFRDELAVQDQTGRLVYSIPDFIALKEVFVDLYLTPYRRRSHLWRVKAVSFEDGRVYLQNSRTIARRPEKLSPKAAFTTHLMGLHTQGHDSNGKKTVVPFPGQHWQVYWGEFEGLGLLYSSPVDLIDRSAKVTSTAMSRHPQLKDVLKEVVSERHFMYRTHLYQAPQDTQAWKDAMWFTFLEWWADYQFGRLPTIIGGEVTGQTVTAIRLFCAHTLPQLAQAWCDKPAWDTSLGEQYLSSLLRFIKYWCNRRPRETLSFELQENGDVLCCKRRFKIASQHFLVNSILPDDFVRDVYPAPPPQPKPSWPGKRGRKCKPRVAQQLTRPRRVTCHWKLPRYCDVETEPPTSPPRYVFRPEMKDPQNGKASDNYGVFTDACWGLGERGNTQRPARHTRFKNKENNKESDLHGFFTDAGLGLGGWRETHRTVGNTRASRGAGHHSQSRQSLENCDPRRLTKGLTRAQVSRQVDKRAREWYKSTVPSLAFPKSFIAENRDEGRQCVSSSASEDSITSRRNEMLFAPLPLQELKGNAGRQRGDRYSQHSRDREAIIEEDEV